MFADCYFKCFQLLHCGVYIGIEMIIWAETWDYTSRMLQEDRARAKERAREKKYIDANQIEFIPYA